MRKEMFYVTVDNHKFKTQEEAERHEKRYLKDLRAADNFTVRVFNKQNNRWDTIHFKDGEIVEEEYDCNEGKFTDKVSLIEFPSYAAYQVITRKISLFRELFKRTINSRENLKFIIFHTYGYDCIALSEFKKELEKIKEKENEIIEAYGGNWKEIN